MDPILPRLSLEELEPQLSRMEALYNEMDRAYRELAGKVGLSCSGCDDNCCTTRFSHHTASEYVYLIMGFDRIQDDDLKASILDRSRSLCRAGPQAPYLCPLNQDGLCLLYPYRTMICRLHGVPYTLRMPDGRLTWGPGCHRWERLIHEKSIEIGPLDRTPFYSTLAAIEREVRAIIPYPHGLRMTMAEMLCLGRG